MSSLLSCWCPGLCPLFRAVPAALYRVRCPQLWYEGGGGCGRNGRRCGSQALMADLDLRADRIGDAATHLREAAQLALQSAAGARY